MSDYLTNVALGATAPMVSKDKGDFSNRVKCTGAQLVNNAKTLAADTVIIGGAAGTINAMKKGKFQHVQKFFATLVDKVASKLPKKFVNEETGEVIKNISKNGMEKLKKINFKLVDGKLATRLKSLPGLTKAAVAIAAITLPVLHYINRKWTYKQGQIDQKYTDKAKIEKHQKEIL